MDLEIDLLVGGDGGEADLGFNVCRRGEEQRGFLGGLAERDQDYAVVGFLSDANGG